MSINSVSSHAVEAATSRMTNRDIAGYAVSGALVCTTCYLVFRNWQLSSENANLKNVLETSEKGHKTSKDAITKVESALLKPVVEQSASTLTEMVSTLLGSDTKQSNTSVDPEIISALEWAITANDKAIRTIKVAKYQLKMPTTDQNPSLLNEFYKAIIQGAGQAVGQAVVHNAGQGAQQIVQGVKDATNPTTYIRAVLGGGLQWLANAVSGTNPPENSGTK